MADTRVAAGLSSSTDTRFNFGPYWSDVDNAVMAYYDSSLDMNMCRTTNGGATWTETVFETGTALGYSMFYDREIPGGTGDLLHVTWIQNDNKTVKYCTLNSATGAVGTIRTVTTGITPGTSSSQNRLTITKTLSGNIIIGYSTQTEIGCIKSSDNFATAGTVISDVYETALEEDYCLSFPANTGDDNDAASIFLDRSSNTLSVKMYDNSADTWTETTIGSMSDDINHINYDASVRHSDGHLFVAMHSDDDSTGDDLRTYDLTVDSISTPTVTAKTNIFTNQAESAQAGVIINQQNGDIYVSHCKGGTWSSSTDVVFHKSTDGGTSWGTEQAYSETTDDLRTCGGGRTITNAGGRIQWVFYNDDTTSIYVNLVNDIEIVEYVATGLNMQINIGDTWKAVDAMWINIGDTWKSVTAIKQNIGDTWKTI